MTQITGTDQAARLETLSRIHNACAASSVRRAARAVTQFYDAALEPSGLGIAQAGLLLNIEINQGSTRTELARALVMDRTTLVRNLKLLEREGFIETETGDDRRSRLVKLTPAGRAALARVLPYWEQAQKSLLEHVGSERWAGMRSGFDALQELYQD